MSADFAELRLRKGEDRRLRAGHLWVYSNEVDVKHTPLTALKAGSLVNVMDFRGAVLGCGYVNPHSLIAVRLLSRRHDQQPDIQWLTSRVQRALALRDLVYDAPFYRLIYGESDGLPGLVVDRFDECLIVQITTAGMERLQADIVAALQSVLNTAVIVLRNDSPARTQEGLDSYITAAVGALPDLLHIEENGARYEVSLTGSQKTGWFYDHRTNRARMQAYAANKHVLDVFSYVGGWGIQALTAGAAGVVCIDSSAAALNAVAHNAKLNNVDDRCITQNGDAFDVMKQMRQEKRKFDVVVLDPPAFVKRRKDLQQGALAYRRLNTLAMQLLNHNGILVSASCSYHLPRERLMSEIRHAASKAGRIVQIIEQGHQGPDHPVHPAMPETDYLKAFICRIV